MCSLIMLSITNSLGTKNVLSIKNPSQTAASCETLVSISDECSNIFEANEQGHCECLKVGYDCNEIERISIFSTKPHGARAFQVYENRFCENKTNEFGEFNLLQVKNERQTIEACADAVFSHGILCSALFHLHDGKCECVKPGRTCNHKQATNAAVYQITNFPILSRPFDYCEAMGETACRQHGVPCVWDQCDTKCKYEETGEVDLACECVSDQSTCSAMTGCYWKTEIGELGECEDSFEMKEAPEQAELPEAPEPAELPEAPEAPEAPEPAELPEALEPGEMPEEAPEPLEPEEAPEPLEPELRKPQFDSCSTWTYQAMSQGPQICSLQRDQYGRQCMWDGHDMKCRKFEYSLQRPRDLCEAHPQSACESQFDVGTVPCVWDAADMKCRKYEAPDADEPGCELIFDQAQCVERPGCSWVQDEEEAECEETEMAIHHSGSGAVSLGCEMIFDATECQHAAGCSWVQDEEEAECEESEYESLRQTGGTYSGAFEVECEGRLQNDCAETAGCRWVIDEEEAECEEDEYVNFPVSGTSTNTGVTEESPSTAISSQTSVARVEVDSLCENYFSLEECNNVAGCLWIAEDYECESIQLAKARQMGPMGPMPMPGGAGMECDREEMGKTGMPAVIPLMMGQQSAAACAQAVRTNQWQCSTTFSWSMMRGCGCVRIGEVCDFENLPGSNVYSTGMAGMGGAMGMRMAGMGAGMAGMGAGMSMGTGMGMGMRTSPYGSGYGMGGAMGMNPGMGMRPRAPIMSSRPFLQKPHEAQFGYGNPMMGGGYANPMMGGGYGNPMMGGGYANPMMGYGQHGFPPQFQGMGGGYAPRPYLQATKPPLQNANPSTAAGEPTGKVVFGWVAVVLLLGIITLTCYCTHKALQIPAIKSHAISSDAFMANHVNISEESEEMLVDEDAMDLEIKETTPEGVTV